MHIDLIACKQLGNLVALSDRTAIALFKVAGAPGAVEMMNRHSPFLGIHASTQHRRGAKEHSHLTFVHGSNDRLPCLLVLAFLNEAYLVGRDSVVLHQFPLYFGIDRPTTSWLIRSQVGEHKLRTLLLVKLSVVFGNCCRTVRSLVVWMVAIRRVYHAHIQCHLSGIVRGNEHLCLFLRVRQRSTAENRSIASFGKLHQFLDEDLLVWCRLDVMQYLVHLWPVHTHVLCSSVVRDFVIELSQFRHLDEVSEPLLLDDVVRHRELKVRRFLGEDSGPCIEAAYVLTLQFLRSKVLEEQIQFRQAVADGRTRQKRGAQVLALLILHGADGKKQVECPLASQTVAKSCHTVVTGVEHQVLELVRLVHEDVVDAHLAEVHHIVRPRADGILDTFQLLFQIGLTLLQPLQHHARNVLAAVA